MAALNITRQQCFNAIIVITVATVFLLVVRTMTNERTITFLSAPKSTFLSGRLSFLSSFFFSNNGSDSDDDESSSETLSSWKNTTVLSTSLEISSRDGNLSFSTPVTTPNVTPVGPSLEHADKNVTVISWQDEDETKRASSPADGVLNNLTIVTAYFDIGSFGKGSPSNVRGNQTYLQWFEKFGHLNNPLIFYTDSNAFIEYTLRLRQNLTSCTRIVKVSRDLLWAFRVRSKVAELYAQPGYPKHYPNTVNPDYTCAMHAKFAVMRNAILNRYFPSVHYAWIDVGCFRDLNVVPDEEITLVPPPDLNPSRVMYSEVYDANFNLTPSQIFRGNIVWVGGASFVGKRDVILQYAEQYRRAAENFLYNSTLSNSDQQVIYSMYSNEGRKLVMPQVELQTVRKDWFGVGYHCIRRSKEKQPACVNV